MIRRGQHEQQDDEDSITPTTTTGRPVPPAQLSSWNEDVWKSIQWDANQSAIHLVNCAFLVGNTDNEPHRTTQKTILQLQIFAQRILVYVQQLQQQQPLMPLSSTESCGPENEAPPTATMVLTPNGSSSVPFTIATTTTISPPEPPHILLSSQFMTVTEGMHHLPVEQLCPTTGKVLRTFPNGKQAQQFISTSAQPQFFWYAVQGTNKGTAPHIYKKFFWRLQGSHHVPGQCPCHHPTGNLAVTSPTWASTPVVVDPARSFSSNRNNVLQPLDSNINHGGATPSSSTCTHTPRRRRDPFRDLPVEMVDVTTCQVVHTFATAQEAHTVMSGTGIAQFGNFKKVLMGHHRFPHSIYKGYLFRWVGSDKVPPKGYRPTRPPAAISFWNGRLVVGPTPQSSSTPLSPVVDSPSRCHMAQRSSAFTTTRNTLDDCASLSSPYSFSDSSLRSASSDATPDLV